MLNITPIHGAHFHCRTLPGGEDELLYHTEPRVGLNRVVGSIQQSVLSCIGASTYCCCCCCCKD